MVGAVAILFLSVIIMFNLKLTDIISVKGTEYNMYPLAFILVSILFISFISFSIINTLNLPIKLFDFFNLSMITDNYNILDWDTTFRFIDPFLSISLFIYTSFNLLLILVGIILLLAIIGAIVLIHRI